jgi:hypothetical protein
LFSQLALVFLADGLAELGLEQLIYLQGKYRSSRNRLEKQYPRYQQDGETDERPRVDVRRKGTRESGFVSHLQNPAADSAFYVHAGLMS